MPGFVWLRGSLGCLGPRPAPPFSGPWSLHLETGPSARPKGGKATPGSSERSFHVPGALGVAGAAESGPASRMGKLRQERGPGRSTHS